MLKEITVSQQQAEYLAQKLSVCHAAEREFKEALWLLTLGHDVATLALLDINRETGALTFAPPSTADQE